MVGMIYPVPTYIFNWHISPKLLAAYIQYKLYFLKSIFPTLRPKGAQNLSNLHLSPKGWHDISNTNKYIQLIYILLIEYFPTLRPKGSQKISKLHSSPRVGIIYPISPYIFNWLYILEIVYFPTLCPKGAQKLSNLHLSHGWHDISDTNIYF